MRNLRFVHFAPALLLLTACPSLSILHTARPIEVGKMEIGASAGPYGVIVNTGTGSRFAMVPIFEFGLRYGAHEMFDFGVKFTTGLMLQMDLNFAPVVFDEFALSIDPTAAVSAISDGNSTIFIIYLWAPVLADVVNLDFMTVTIGIKPGVSVLTGTLSTSGSTNVGFTGTTGLLGGSLGIKFKLGETLRLMPEFVLIAPLAPGSNGFIFEGQLGLMFEF